MRGAEKRGGDYSAVAKAARAVKAAADWRPRESSGARRRTALALARRLTAQRETTSSDSIRPGSESARMAAALAMRLMMHIAEGPQLPQVSAIMAMNAIPWARQSVSVFK